MAERKKISILVPCYNEVMNVEPMAEALTNVMKELPAYDYEIIFRDNASTDGTQEILRKTAAADKHVKVILNCRNYGVNEDKDTYRGRISGDLVISIAADFQEPPELIPEFVKYYEKGYEVVAGQKTGSDEGRTKYGLRQLFYRIIGTFSETPQIPNMSGIVLMSRRIIELWWNSNYFVPFRNFVADLGCDIKLIQYRQQKRRSGHSSYNIWRYLSFSITSLTTTSTAPLRIATILGTVLSVLSFLVGIIYLVMKLILWDSFTAGIAPALIGVFFMGSIQLLFLGLLGEYIAQILQVTTPPVPPVVKELINFEDPDSDQFVIPDSLEEKSHISDITES